MTQKIDLGENICYPPEDLEGLADGIASESDYLHMKHTREAFLRTINTAITFRDLHKEAIDCLCNVRDAKTMREVRKVLVNYLADFREKYDQPGCSDANT